ncbi:unnamed protein product, partial [Choristocarpus tenellus]
MNFSSSRLDLDEAHGESLVEGSVLGAVDDVSMLTKGGIIPRAARRGSAIRREMRARRKESNELPFFVTHPTTYTRRYSTGRLHNSDDKKRRQDILGHNPDASTISSSNLDASKTRRKKEQEEYLGEQAGSQVTSAPFNNRKEIHNNGTSGKERVTTVSMTEEQHTVDRRAEGAQNFKVQGKG